MDIEELLIEQIEKGFDQLFNEELTKKQLKLQPTKKEFAGSFTFVTFPFLRMSKKSPEETGDLLGKYVQENSNLISGYNVVKGFLNFEIADQPWVDVLDWTFNYEEDHNSPKWTKVMIEYSSPNTNKPLHLGHLRNNFLGYSVAEILKEVGYDVTKVNLVNDRGIHICKSMLAYQKYGDNETPQTSGVKGDHLIGNYYVKFDQEYKKEIETLIGQGKTEEEAKKEAPLIVEAQLMLKKWEDGDSDTVALWKKMNGWVYEGFEQTYQSMGVNFDHYYYESDTYLLGKNMVNEGLEKGVFFKKEDNSVWADLSADKLDEKLVLRGDGTSVYITQDLGTADLKYKDFGCDKSVYVVGNEQDYHFNILFKILVKLERSYADGMHHLSYGMVDLPSGKMKSREGTVVDADDLIQEMIDTAKVHTNELGKIDDFSEKEAEDLYRVLALGALKYYLLKVDPKKRMLFDPQESIDFHGHTGPFIQYTHARISAILRRAEQMGVDIKRFDKERVRVLHQTEQELIKIVSEYHKHVLAAAEEYAPSVITQYVYDLAKAYNRFYTEVSIFDEKDKEALNFKIVLSSVVASTIKKSMKLLGIEVPNRM